MTRAVKIVAYIAGALVLVVIVALAAAAMIVDGAFVKSRLEKRMKDLGRTLTIEGEPRVRLFPVAGVALGKTTLSEAGSDRLFASLDSAEVAVRVWPLISGEIEVERVAVAGLRANLRRLKDGRTNYDDLAGRERPGDAKAPPGETKAPPPPEERRERKLRVNEAALERIHVQYLDEATGRQVAVEELNVKTGRLDAITPTPLSVSLSVTGLRPDIALKVQVSGNARLDPGHRVVALTALDARATGDAATVKKLDFRLAGGFTLDAGAAVLDVDGVKLAASGVVDGESMSAELSAPKLSVTALKAAGSEITASFNVAGAGRRLQAKLNVAAAEGTAASFSIPAVSLALDATDEGNTFTGRVSTPVKGSLTQQTLELPKLVADFSASGPRIPGKSARLPLQAAIKAEFARQRLNADVAAQPDGANVRLTVAASHFRPLDGTFELNADRLDLNRLLLPLPRRQKSDGRIDLSALEGHKLSGKVRVGAFQAEKLKAADVAADVRLANGRLELAPLSAKLYDGTLKGSVGAEAKGNRVALKQTLEGVSINPLLRDLADKDILEGRGEVVLDVEAAGPSFEAMKKALAGTARLNLKDGAYKGINLGEIIQALRSGRPPATGGSQKTEFSELSASFAVKGGVAHNEDLALRSPYLRAGGSGNLDVGNSRLDYTVRPTLASTASGPGKDAGSSVTVPVHIHGAFDSPRYDVDYAALAASGALERLGGRLGELLGPKKGGEKSGSEAAPSARDAVRDAVRDRLKGLLGR